MRPTWAKIKNEIKAYDREQLLSTICDLYNLSADNKRFMATRFLNDVGSLDEYKKIIRSCINPEPPPKDIKIREARKAINAYKKAIGRPHELLDLMLYFVEQGNQVTLAYGDMWEGFYNSMEIMYEAAAKFLNDSGLPKEHYRERFSSIAKEVRDTGWGYGDFLDDIFRSTFTLRRKNAVIELELK